MPTLLVGLLVVALGFTAYTAQNADASHEPAMKSAAAGSDVDQIGQEGDRVVLTDQIRVSTAQDLVLQLTSECSILTSLITGDDEAFSPQPFQFQDTAYAFGQVKMYVTLDGKRVPVSANDGTGADPEDDPTADPGGNDQGEVVFCNRAYQRTVQDRGPSGDEGGLEQDIDIERDYIRTRTANAFNWVAGNVGDEQAACGTDDPNYCFDAPGNGNNIIDIAVHAIYDINPNGTSNNNSCPLAVGSEITCALAFVGSRTLVTEPIHLAIHESVGDPNGFGN
jgi:hypothetical protein